MAKYLKSASTNNILELKKIIKQLQQEIDKLKSENRTLLEAWAETQNYLEEMTKGESLEELLHKKDLRKKEKKTIMKKHPSKARKNAQDNWKNWRSRQK